MLDGEVFGQTLGLACALELFCWIVRESSFQTAKFEKLPKRARLARNRGGLLAALVKVNQETEQVLLRELGQLRGCGDGSCAGFGVRGLSSVGIGVAFRTGLAREPRRELVEVAAVGFHGTVGDASIHARGLDEGCDFGLEPIHGGHVDECNMTGRWGSGILGRRGLGGPCREVSAQLETVRP